MASNQASFTLLVGNLETTWSLESEHVHSFPSHSALWCIKYSPYYMVYTVGRLYYVISLIYIPNIKLTNHTFREQKVVRADSLSLAFLIPEVFHHSPSDLYFYSDNNSLFIYSLWYHMRTISCKSAFIVRSFELVLCSRSNLSVKSRTCWPKLPS